MTLIDLWGKNKKPHGAKSGDCKCGKVLLSQNVSNARDIVSSLELSRHNPQVSQDRFGDVLVDCLSHIEMFELKIGPLWELFRHPPIPVPSLAMQKVQTA